ncbi:MAG: hypothetical protein ACN6OP_26940, partial [Pseudomonadales bacterium]
MEARDNNGGMQEKTPAISNNGIAFWTALIYGFGVLILAGGAGIWLPAVMPSKSVGIDALTTFVMATLAPIFADLLLDLDVNGRKFSKIWRVSILVACLLSAVLAMIALLREKASGEWSSGVLAIILSLAIWLAVA